MVRVLTGLVFLHYNKYKPYNSSCLSLTIKLNVNETRANISDETLVIKKILLTGIEI